MSIKARLAGAALAVAALAITPAGASAGIWTQVNSGTTEEIAAVDYRADAFRFATKSGKIFKQAGDTFTIEGTFAGRQFFDLAMSPSGALGLASADSGKLFRFSGGAWSEVNMANSTFAPDFPCGGSGGPEPAAAPTANILAVAWGSESVAWAVTGERGQILKSTDGGATWNDASRAADNTCKLNGDVTDVAAVVGSDQDVYFVDDNFGTLWRTADQLLSAAQERIEMVNCFGVVFRLAVDPTAANRVVASGACDGTLHQGFTSDSGSTKNYTDSGGANLRDTAAQAGVFLSVGDAGKIEQTFDGKTVFGQPADGALSTKDWRAVDFKDASNAAVGGVGGALVTTTQANVMPDVVPPTVAITGPDTVSAGTPTAFTAAATDNPGGVGIDPAGFQWTGTGLTPSTASSATYTFSGVGTFTIRVKARDLRGNVSEEATKTVTVVLPKFTLPTASKPPISGKGAKAKGGFFVVNVKGKFPPPAGFTEAQACTGDVFIRLLKGKRLLVFRKTKLPRKCSYRKKVRVRRSKVGKAKKLKLRISFGGNQFVAPVEKTWNIKVRR